MAWRELIPGDPSVKVYDREHPVRRLTNEEMREWISRYAPNDEAKAILLEMYPVTEKH